MERACASGARAWATSPPSGADLIEAAFVGVVGGAALVFSTSPAGVSTLVHDALGIKAGPGTGLGMLVGPWAAFTCLVAAALVRRRHAALAAGVALAVAYSLPAALVPPPLPNPGMLGSLRAAVGLALVGASVEACLAVYARLSKPRLLALSAAVGDLAFLAYNWAVVFPLTKGWVTPRNAVVIAALSLPCALAAAALALVADAVAGPPEPMADYDEEEG